MLKRFLVTIKWLLFSLVALIALVFIGLNIPATQRYFGKQLSVFLSQKVKKEIKVEQVGINIWTEVTLKHVSIPDNSNNTLLAFDYLAINLDFWDFFDNKIHIEEIILEQGQFNIQRNQKGSSFNFDYLIAAFSSPTTKTTSEQAFIFELDKIQLHAIKGVYLDNISGMQFKGTIGSLNTGFNTFDLTNKQIALNVLQLSTTQWYFNQGNNSVDNQPEETISNWLLKASLLKIENTIGEYINNNAKISLHSNLQFVESTNIVVDIENLDFSVDEFLFNNNTISYEYATITIDSNTTQANENGQNWHFKTEHLAFNNNRINYINTAHIDTVKSNKLDFENLHLSDLSLDITKLEASPNNASASINSLQVKTGKLFALQSFKGDIALEEEKLFLSHHQLKTAFSSIDYNLNISFPSISKLLENPQLTNVALFELDAHLHQNDISTFVAENPIPKTIQTIDVDIALNGFVDALNINTFIVKSENKIALASHGQIKGLPNLDSLHYEITIEDFKTNLLEIRQLAQDQLSKQVNLPHWITLQGTIKGSSTTNETHLTMDSEMGQASIDALVDFKPKQEKYTLSLLANKLSVGTLIGRPELVGNLSGSATLSGQYFDPNKLIADAHVKIASVELDNHIYKNGDIQLQWENKSVQTKLSLEDDNLNFTINSTGKWTNESLSTQNEIRIKKIDFQALQLSKRPIKLQTTIDLETKGLSLEDLYVQLTIREGSLQANEDKYNLASSSIKTDFQKNSSFLKINSPALLLDFESEFNIVELPSVLEAHFKHYFELSHDETEALEEGKNFSFSTKIINKQLFEGILIPELHELEMNKIEMEYNSKGHLLHVLVDVPHVKYSDYELDSIQVNCNSTANKLIGDLAIEKIKMSGFTFYYPSCKFQAADNLLAIEIALCDAQRKQKFGVKGELQNTSDVYTWHTTEQNGVMLYYQDWQVEKDNKITIDTNSNIQFAHFSLFHEEESIRAIDNKNKEILIDFDNFTIQNITSILYPENASIKGLIDGSLLLDFKQDALLFDSDIHITDFTYLHDTIGNVSLKAQHLSSGLYTAKLDVTGENRLVGNMSYNPLSDKINGQLDLTKFELAGLSKRTNSFVKDLTGIAKGHIAVDGTMSEPNFKGKLQVKNAAFHVIATNTSYEMKHFDMEFNNNKVSIQDLLLVDNQGNNAVANGYMTIKQFSPDKLLFDVKMDKFPLLNTTKQKDQLVYGNLAVSSTLKIKGTFQLPEVDAKLKLTPGSELTLVVPETEINTEDYSDVIEFVDFEHPKEKDTISITPDNNTVRNIQINAALEVTPDVTLRVIVDPIAGDFMEIKGAANLNFTLTPDGEMKLIGIYTAKEGHYLMTYHNVIKRKFNINNGSTVSWSGDPFDPFVDISAIYTTKTSPLPLVQAQLASSQVNSFKQSIPVNVVLNITDHMLAPKLNFDIELPNYNVGSSSIVTTKLNRMRNSESEMNKQAFSLLVLNRFIPEGTSQNTASNSLKSTARGSVSQIISDQFNTLAGNYIKSVNVNFNLDSYTDYSDGEAKGRTDLEIELSKAIFNDKIVVTVGSDFNVEGSTSDEEVNNIVGNVKAVYSIDEDGHYLIKVYRKNEYAGVIDGNITKTGLSFIFSKEFQKLINKEAKKKPQKKNR